MTLVKICGITSLADALGSIEAGADALGFNFYRPSPRYLTPLAASDIVRHLPKEILTVGVFVNERSPELVERTANEAGVAAVQLHGEESPEYCAAFGSRLVIKVFRVRDGFRTEVVKDYKVEAVMVDAFDAKLHGGTGRVVDWSVAIEVNKLVPKMFLAGGLSPENVAAAVTRVKPFAVDACSALESSPGKKDMNRIREFVKIVRKIG